MRSFSFFLQHQVAQQFVDHFYIAFLFLATGVEVYGIQQTEDSLLAAVEGLEVAEGAKLGEFLEKRSINKVAISRKTGIG